MIFDVIRRYLDLESMHLKPIHGVVIGFSFVLIGFMTSSLIFSSQLSLVMVAFSSLFILPYVIRAFELHTMRFELHGSHIDIGGLKKKDAQGCITREWIAERLRNGYSPGHVKQGLIKHNIHHLHVIKSDLNVVDELNKNYIKSSNFFSRHKRIIKFYVFLFLGMSLAYIFLYGILSPELVERTFAMQLDRMSLRGRFSSPGLFHEIVSNNLKISLICILLSFFYGSGAIFILNYNSSIAGVLYGSSLRVLIWGAEELYTNPLIYIPHTTIEILAYLLAAISGGILSKISIHAWEGSSKLLLKDAGIFYILSVILIFAAGYVEVMVI